MSPTESPNKTSNQSSEDVKIVYQANQLISHACEYRKVLLLYEREILPYKLKSVLRSNDIDETDVDEYLETILSKNDKASETGEFKNPTESDHQELVISAENLCQLSNRLNESLNVEIDGITGFV